MPDAFPIRFRGSIQPPPSPVNILPGRSRSTHLGWGRRGGIGFLIVAGLTALSGCAGPRTEAGIRARHLSYFMLVEVVKNEGSTTGPVRRVSTLNVKEPFWRAGATVHLIIDGATPEWPALATVGSRWRIRFNDDGFDQERSTGFSPWPIAALDPVLIRDQSVSGH